MSFLHVRIFPLSHTNEENPAIGALEPGARLLGGL